MVLSVATGPQARVPGTVPPQNGGMTIDFPATATLSREDEIRLAKRIEAGVFAGHLLAGGEAALAGRAATRDELARVAADGEAAWDAFYVANLRLVRLIATHWAGLYRLDTEDAFQEGCVGLAHAIRRWDHARGTKFCTLAWREITWRVREHCLRRGGASQAPSWWMATQRDLRRRGERLCPRLEPAAVVGELARQVGRPPDWVQTALTWEPPAYLPDLPDAAPPLRAPDRTGTRACQAGLTHVPGPERHVIVGRFGLSGARQTYQNLADAMGCSVRQVKRLEAQGLDCLRRAMTDDGLAPGELVAL